MHNFRTFFLISILFFFSARSLDAMSFDSFFSKKSQSFIHKSQDITDQNWRFIWGNDLSKIYFKINSKKINENIINLEALTDYVETSTQWDSFSNKTNGLSEIEKVSFDCAHNKYRSLGGSWFENHQAKGLIKSTYAEKENWSEIPSFYQKLYEIACAQPSEQRQ